MAAVAAALGLGVPSLAAPAAGAQPPGAVSPTPAVGTPHLKTKTTTTQNIRQIVQCGTTMYAVGSFNEIKEGGASYTRHNIFSFSASSPYTVTSWAPNVNGTINSIAFNGTRCGRAYIGGSFTSIGSTHVRNVAEISTSSRAVISKFRHNANGTVNTIVGALGHMLVGGQFTYINGSSADPYFTSLKPWGGVNDGLLRLRISGHYHYCDPTTKKCSGPSLTQVYNQQISHSGTLDLVEGTFTSAGGKARQQIFMMNIGVNPAIVTGWTSPEWDGSKGNLPGGYPYQCWFTEPFYMRAAAWSPDDKTIYIASTGNHPWNLSSSVPRSGLCDSTAAFPSNHSKVYHAWVNYTGCDSLYSVAADSAAVYVAGHPRWSQNPDGCNTAGPGAVVDPGLQGLDPANNGATLLDSTTGNALYTMSRANADDMLLTSAGLWIASSNRFASEWCGPLKDHSGICFLPY